MLRFISRIFFRQKILDYEELGCKKMEWGCNIPYTEQALNHCKFGKPLRNGGPKNCFCHTATNFLQNIVLTDDIFAEKSQYKVPLQTKIEETSELFWTDVKGSSKFGPQVNFYHEKAALDRTISKNRLAKNELLLHCSVLGSRLYYFFLCF